ncbi:MAG: sugar phosphate nucleotidyltransferase [Candidatus Krumholzibacteriia bacterium]
MEEPVALGTAGSLALIQEPLERPFILTNCDNVIDADFADLLAQHAQQGNLITMVVSLKKYKIPYGVCDIESGGRLKGMREKPEFDYLVNTGMYVVSPAVLPHIVPDRVFHMTDLMDAVRAAGGRVASIPSARRLARHRQWAEYKRTSTSSSPGCATGRGTACTHRPRSSPSCRPRRQQGHPRARTCSSSAATLLERAIGIGLATPAVDRVIVSTDDPEIAAVGRTAGAQIHARPSELATDGSKVIASLRHLGDTLLDAEGAGNALLVLLEPTCPLRAVADVTACIELLGEGRHDSVATFTAAHTNPWRATGPSKATRPPLHRRRQPVAAAPGAAAGLRAQRRRLRLLAGQPARPRQRGALRAHQGGHPAGRALAGHRHPDRPGARRGHAAPRSRLTPS